MEVTRTFDLIDLNVEKYPRDVMYGGKSGKEWISYSTQQVRDNVDYVSAGLLSLGFKRGDKIATISGNKAEWNFADMGMAQVGVIHVPIYPTISTNEYSYILRHAGIKTIFLGNKSIYNRISAVVEYLGLTGEIYSFEQVDKVRSFNEIIIKGKENYDKYAATLETIRKSILPEDLLTIIYTSGTTGNPKGVMLSHKNILSNAITTSYCQPFGYGYRAASFLPLCHVYERMMNYHYQYKGTSIYYIDNMGAFQESVRKIRPHIFNVVPRLLEKVYDNIMATGKNLPTAKKFIFNRAVKVGIKYKLHGNSILYKLRLAVYRKLVFSKWKEALGGELKLMIGGGAAMQPKLEKIFWAADMPIAIGYGLTETSPVIAVNPYNIDDMRFDDMRFGTVGPVIKGVDVKLANDGEILCKGENLMMGYYNAPELTSDVIDDEGWFHTGDIGIFIEERFLKITDRKKEVFKLSAGKYVAPQPIENKLKESIFIEQALVIGENEKFASALISPNFDYLHDWCSKNKIQYRDNAMMIETPEVIDRISKEVKKINKELSEHEHIKRFRLVTEEWTPQTGELSPTLKLKRNYLTIKYREIISEIYFDKDKEVSVINKIKQGIEGTLKNLPKF